MVTLYLMMLSNKDRYQQPVPDRDLFTQPEDRAYGRDSFRRAVTCAARPRPNGQRKAPSHRKWGFMNESSGCLIAFRKRHSQAHPHANIPLALKVACSMTRGKVGPRSRQVPSDGHL